jgi:hypothetical protein
MASLSSATAAGINLNASDFDRLAGLLAAMPEFRAVQSRMDFLDDVFAGLPRRNDLQALFNLDGTARGVAVRVISRLTQFGQDEPGRETLGVLINKLLSSYIGSGEDAIFLRELFTRYPLQTEPVAARPAHRQSDQPVLEQLLPEPAGLVYRPGIALPGLSALRR